MLSNLTEGSGSKRERKRFRTFIIYTGFRVSSVKKFSSNVVPLKLIGKCIFIILLRIMHILTPLIVIVQKRIYDNRMFVSFNNIQPDM